MQKRNFGKTKLKISGLSLGCRSLGGKIEEFCKKIIED